jgi:hypothetical protein
MAQVDEAELRPSRRSGSFVMSQTIHVAHCLSQAAIDAPTRRLPAWTGR